MIRKAKGRITASVPISMAPEMTSYVDERVEALKPRVSSRSNYFQQLVELDRKYDLLQLGVPTDPAMRGAPARPIPPKYSEAEAVREAAAQVKAQARKIAQSAKCK